VRYSRFYATSLGPVSLESSTNAANYAVYGRAGWVNRISPRDELAASIELWQLWQRVSGYADPAAAFNPFDATIATGTDRTSLVRIGGQWTHLFGSSVEGNINGGYVRSFASHAGIVAAVTGDGIVTPTMGDQGWFEYGGRLGFRITQGWVADLFVNGTLGPQPVGNTIHGGVGLRVNYWRLLIARLTAIADDTTLPLISQGKEKGAEGGVRWQSRGSESTPTTRAPTPSSPTRRCSRWRRRRASSSNGCPIR
jgi:hypothetical protein